jgi:hypothetical protein
MQTRARRRVTKRELRDAIELAAENQMQVEIRPDGTVIVSPARPAEPSPDLDASREFVF